MSKSTFEEELSRTGILHYTISGVSMLPLLHQHKDIVVIKKADGRLKKYDVALYKMPDGRYILHRILKVREKDYIICGDNCIRREYGITDRNIIGVMTEYIRNGKPHSVNDAGYRLYSHAIANLYHIKAAVLWNKKLLVRTVRKAGKILKNTAAL